jgi:DNA-binding transcriptional LysR family regulator
VLHGVGMCVLPDYLCREEIQRGDLATVLPGWEPRTAMVLAVYPSRRGMVPAVRRLLDFLGQNIVGERIVTTAAASA